MSEETEHKENDSKNPFVKGFFKNAGREVTVAINTPDGLVKISGKCEALELQQKCVIVRNDKSTYFIKNYLWIERPRKFKEEVKNES